LPDTLKLRPRVTHIVHRMDGRKKFADKRLKLGISFTAGESLQILPDNYGRDHNPRVISE